MRLVTAGCEKVLKNVLFFYLEILLYVQQKAWNALS